MSEVDENLDPTQSPDVIMIPHGRLKEIYTHIMHARRRFGWKPVLCIHLTERFSPHRVLRHIDYVLPYLPFVAYGEDFIKRLEREKADGHLRGRAKTKFCNFVYSNSYPFTKTRRDFCQKLMKYKRVDCPGSSLNNMPHIIEYNTPEGKIAKLDFIASYKFTIAFENASVPGYISEKIFHPLIVGSIPIYWGCPDIDQYINPHSFINCHKFNSFDEVIEEVKRIDNDREIYEKYLNAPPIRSDSRLHLVKKKTIETARLIVSEILSRSHSGTQQRPPFCWHIRIFFALLIASPKVLRNKLCYKRLPWGKW